MAARRSPRRPQRRRRDATRLRQATRGDRPYLAGLVVLIALVGAMAVGPLQSYGAATDRVAALEDTRAELQAEVDRLEDKRRRLTDVEELELMAREQLGLVKPGEIPFVVVTGEDELHALGPEAGEQQAGELPWHRRVWQAVATLLQR